MYAPPAIRRNGSSQRPVPKSGLTVRWAHSVRLPCPAGRKIMIIVTTPRTSRVSPNSDRATSGETDRVGNDHPRRRREVVRRVVVVRRFVAISGLDLDHDREDHRPPLRLLVQVAR